MAWFPTFVSPDPGDPALPRRLYAYALRLCRGNEDAAYDLVQETLLETAKHPDAYEAGGRFWLFRVLTNKFNGGYRESRRVDPLPDDEHAWVDRVDPATARPPSNPEEELCRAALRRKAAELIDREREPHRTILLMWAAGLRYREIAASVGLKLGTVTSYAAQARARIQKALRAWEGGA